MIWLIRHGESAANAGLATSVYSEIPITEFGYQQAEGIARLIEPRPDRIVISPYLRAQQTAQATLRRYPDVPTLTEPVQEFNYINRSNVPMTGKDRVPLVNAYWTRLDPEYVDGSDSESFGMFVERVQYFLKQAQTWTGFTVVFTHEQFMRGLLQAILLGGLEASRDSMQRFYNLRSVVKIHNGRMIKLEFRDGKPWLHVEGGTPD